MRLALVDDAGAEEDWSVGDGRTEAGTPGALGGPGGKPPTGLHSRFFGDYELLDEIARGGMGVVYRARQLSLKRVVALKMVHATHLASPEARMRFALEVATAAQLNHPNIVSLYESGEVKGVHFFTMRLVEGGDLAQHIQARRAGPGRVVPCGSPPLQSAQSIAAFLIKSARALHYAHQRGILHRDIKPSNILIDLEGQPHLADFGLAKMLARESANTYTDSILGSPNYMAPEQASGLNSELTVATDVYGLGTVLYEALTGVPPFQAGTPVETIRKVIDEDPIPPRKLASGVDPDLETICLKCIEKKPESRYATAEQLAEDLERWREGRPIVARPIGVFGMAWRWSRRHPGVTALSAALVVALVSLVLGVGIAAVKIRDAERRAVGHLREALAGHAHALTLLAEKGQRSEAIKLVAQAEALGGTPEYRRRLRDELLAALALTDMTFMPQLNLGDAADRYQTVLDPAMEQWIQVQDQTNLVLRRVVDGAVLRRTGIAGPAVTRLESSSSDGRYVGTRDAGGLRIWDVVEGRVVFATNDARRAYCFRHGQAEMALVEDDDSIRFLELPSGRRVSQIHPPGEPRSNGRRRLLSWSPDAEWIASAPSADNALELLEVATGAVRWRSAFSSKVTAVAWIPEQERLAVGFEDGNVRLVSIANGASTALHNSATSIIGLAVSEEAMVLASLSEELLSVMDLRSGRRIFFGKFRAGNLMFDRGGSRLGPVQRGAEIGWLDLSCSSEFRQFTVGRPAVERCQFSADSRLLIGGYASSFSIRRASDGSALERIPGGPLPVFAWDPLDGGVVTSDPTRGVRRWRIVSNSSGGFDVAKPEAVLPKPLTARALAYSADGQRVIAAFAGPAHAIVFDRTFTNSIAALGPHAEAGSVVLNRDGRTAATAGGPDGVVRVWDVTTRRVEATLAAGRRSRVDFSGDGRWLMVHGEDGFNLYRTGDWSPAPPLPFSAGHVVRGVAAFSDDARMLAVTVEGFDVQLFDLGRWEAIGLLRSPTSRHCRSLAFSPDGTRLAAGCTRGVMRVWALDEIRKRLSELNLDWEMPPLRRQAGN